MFKNTFILLIVFAFLVTSCDTMQQIKGGLTGRKQKSTDEFLVQKKDPLILPPDFEQLPTPDDRKVASEKLSSFEKILKKTSPAGSTPSTASSAEESILQQIKKK